MALLAYLQIIKFWGSKTENQSFRCQLAEEKVKNKRKCSLILEMCINLEKKIQKLVYNIDVPLNCSKIVPGSLS